MTSQDDIEFSAMKNLDRFYQGYFKHTLAPMLDKGVVIRNGRRIDNIKEYNYPAAGEDKKHKVSKDEGYTKPKNRSERRQL